MTGAWGGDPLEGALLDGRYRVGARIATGGTSTVYRGLDERLDRPVAVKVMDLRYAGDQQFLTRFQLEARAVARLKDPGLVAVYDQGFGTPHDPGQPFLVMELVEGGTLRELLNERGPMPPHAVAAVLRPVLGALGIAHQAGLVHRDIKPENILISDDGDVKVVDFGLVRAIAAAGITSTNVILGTAAYLSPEQVRDGNAGPASDVYGAGVLTYELLTGHTPFSGDSSLTVAYQRLDHDVPAPSSAIDGVPGEFDDLVARATAREPAERYADALEMARAVDAITERLALPAFRVPAPRNSAQHNAAAPARRAAEHPAPPQHPTSQHQVPQHQTLHMTRGPADWVEDTDTQYELVTGQFGGVELSRFVLERQHARRMVVIWLAVLFATTTLVAALAWALGNNVGALL
ncbi:protein kinase domain-containing protein [Mycobacterium sp. P7213]|uniref:protein kinase domain-containing protein n=1 Tax=Mycobacterium sp. P7213 TaxID=2478465 RepID=UPI001F149815|nr:protein kinase [Mycobacterium sp. P7213]